jgi:hypothetical protein
VTGFDETDPPDDETAHGPNPAAVPGERPASMEDEAERAAEGADEWPGPDEPLSDRSGPAAP